MKRFFVAVGILCAFATVVTLLTRERNEAKPFTRQLERGAMAAPSGEKRQETVVRGANPIAATAEVQPEKRRLVAQEEHWQAGTHEGVFADFKRWTERYGMVPTTPEATGLVQEGVALAKERRTALLDLIRNDPERALGLAVPYGIRRTLPAAVGELLEEPVSGRGQLALLAALPEPGKESLVASNIRTVTIRDRTFDAHVYGWRLGEPTRNNIPLHGIAIGNDMAVSADVVRLLDKDEADAVQALTGTGFRITNPAVLDMGGTYQVAAHHSPEMDEILNVATNGAPDPDQDPFDPQPSAYTEGIKDIIMIRIDFPDLAGDPVSEATATTIVANVGSFYSEMSYRKVTLNLVGEGSVITPTLRLTNSAAYYGTNDFYVKLRTDARAAATAAGYVLGDYQFDVICMGAVPGFGWAGLGYVGAPGSWIRNSFSTSGGVTAHELGHNFGLNHANFWETGGDSIIGPGTSVEYGDIFENMGSSGSIPNGHHNSRYKNYLNWLTSSEVQTAATNGIYRITAHDNPNATGIRGLRVVKNSSTNYWVELRQKYTSNKYLMNGAALRWTQNGNQKSQLLDTTPGVGTSSGKTDAALVIGRTFSDKQAGIHITPIGKGGTVPESLDVQVNLGTFPNNVPPTVSISASVTNAAVGQILSFTATASDANGDALAYYWDFGDGNFGTNGPAATKSWATNNMEYIVRCEVSDMKGGVGSAWVIVRIGSPATFRISGTVTSSGVPVQGARVYTSSTRVGWTDSAGNYSIVGLSSGSHTVNARLDGYVFAPLGFSNPVPVGPNASNINFLDGQGVPFITKHPASQTNYVGENLVLAVDVSGAAPLRYQWQFQNAPLAGATNSTYLISDTQLTNSGAYRVVVTNHFGTATSLVANVTIQDTAIVQTLFTENFDSSPGTGWITNRSSTDTSVTLDYDYASDGIPPAPFSSGNNTRGVKFEANMNNGAIAAISISPVGQNFTGDYRLRFDMWINANGPFPGGGAGSTEHLTAGVGTAGNRVQWNNAGSTADGYWFAVSGEGGATATTSGVPDFAAFTAASLLSASSTAYMAGTASNPRDNAHPYYATNFPGGQSPPQLQRNTYSQQTGTLTQGTAGFAWRDVVITKTGSTVEWFIDGLKIARISGAGSPSTNIFIGYMDGYSSLSDNRALSFGIVDNLRVERTIFAPVITAAVTNRTVAAGQSSLFRVTATGTAPSYQWQFNSTNIAGATSSTYTLLNAQADKAGPYTVVVSNAAGVVSSTGELTVVQPPVITSEPLSQTIFVKGSASFSVVAQGTDPLSYQWRRDGTNLVGRTASQFVLSNAQLTDAGNYSVVVTNSAGTITSATATLNVNGWSITGGSGAFNNGHFGFTLRGAEGQAVIIEGSSNLETWTPLQTNTFSSDPLAFIDSGSNPLTNRFYRLREAD